MPEKPILYSWYRSSPSWRVRIALYLKGIDYDYRPIDLVSGEQKTAEYKAINPYGFIPCLVHDGCSFSDSMAIIEYLDEKFPHTKKLLPEKPEDRAQITSNIQPVQSHRVKLYVDEIAPGKASEFAKHWIEVGLEALERQLQNTTGKFAYGDEITLADLCIPPQVYNAEMNGVDVSQYSIVSRINKTLQEIPEFQKAHANNQPDTPK